MRRILWLALVAPLMSNPQTAPVRAPRSGVTLTGSFVVGGAWTFAITGVTPRVAVTIRAFQGAAPDQRYQGTSNFGNTDSAGNWTRTGTFGTGDAGRWIETVFVGGTEVATINFTVR